ncbi:YncE family protein [Streptomyces sp. NBC_00063]|uniref:YncE family protein n=1 Tax=Streptomyces sp. NBC_00063 TaxID=2975638 RepID=UPI003D7338A2
MADVHTDPLLMVCSSTARNLDFFNAATGKQLETLNNLRAEPHEIAWDSRRRLAYITHTYRGGIYGYPNTKGHEISVVDPMRRSIIDVIDIAPYVGPHDVEYDAKNDLIYTGVENVDGRNGIVVIDPDTRRVVRNIPTEAANCHWLALTPDGLLYVSHKEAPFISIVDPVGGRVIGTVELPGGAEEIDASPDGRWVFVNAPMQPCEFDKSAKQMFKGDVSPGAPAPRLVRIDTRTHEISAELEFDDYNSGIRVAADNSVVISHMELPSRPVGVGSSDTAGGGSAPLMGKVIVVDGTKMQMTGEVAVGPMPLTVRTSPDSRRAWCASLGDGYVYVIDLDTLKVLDRLDNNADAPVGATHGMCLVPPATADLGLLDSQKRDESLRAGQ